MSPRLPRRPSWHPAFRVLVELFRGVFGGSDDPFARERAARAAVSVEGVAAVHSIRIRRPRGAARTSLIVEVADGVSPTGAVADRVRSAVIDVVGGTCDVTVRVAAYEG